MEAGGKRAEIEGRIEALLEPALEPGETLAAAAIGMRQRLFRPRMVAVGITAGRLLLQEAGADWEPTGDPVALESGEIAGFGTRNGNDEFRNRVMLGRATTIEVKPVTGRRIQLVMISGDSGALGPGGEDFQLDQIAAIIEWLTGNV